MSVGIKTTAVDKMCVLHAKTFGALVHLVDKGSFAAHDMLCHCNAGIVGTCDTDAFDHRIHSLRFAGL